MQKTKWYGLTTAVLVDYITALLAWCCFFLFRKIYIEKTDFTFSSVLQDKNFQKGILLIPLVWLVLYFFTNSYSSLLLKSRLNELFKTMYQSLIGSILFFFSLMLNDYIRQYGDYYRLIGTYFLIHFSLTYIGRFLILTIIHQKIKTGKIFISTLLLGNENRCKLAEEELVSSRFVLPYKIIAKKTVTQDETISFIEPDNYENVILAFFPEEKKQMEAALILFLNRGKSIKMLSDESDILSGKYKTQSIFGTSLIEIPTEILDLKQRILKRSFDFVASFLGLIILSPLLLYLVIRVKLSSPGSVFFKQERVGQHNKPFQIVKFRSMVENAENGIPQLSSENDARITSFGKTLRKYRLDELPQLYNVLIGDMSLVGPRPERAFFIKQIIETAPQYQLLQRIKPGITSLGMVKYGYASNLKEMLQRMHFDMLYIENMSILMDLKIMLYTVMILAKGKGK